MSQLFSNFMNNMKKDGFQIIYAQIRRDGRIIGDWARFSSRPRFESYSTAKTFTGVGVGIAIDEGLITLDECVADSFKEEIPDHINPNALEITVKDLLTMTSGMERAMYFRESHERAHTHDWVKHIYKAGSFTNKPGTTFLYNNANTYLLSCLIGRKSGQNLYEYLRHRLFEPLAIHNPDWTICPKGQTVAANGMGINADEMGRFGQMLLDGGVFEGQRIVSKSYVNDMLRTHVVTDDVIPGGLARSAGYGYQIWVDDLLKCAYLWGIFGQYCIVMPEKNAVITIMALQDDDGGSNGNYASSPLRERIWNDLVTQL